MAKSFRTGLVIVSGLILATSHIALAQSSTSQEITVTAPQVTVQKAEKGPSGFSRVMVYSADRQVSFADLDLTTDAGIDTFRTRIRDAARDACEQISKEYPMVEDASCERVAIAHAAVRANQIIDAAKM